ncbi:hypothetical protein COX58_01560 [archaeon CG_4_10_14_0_2_um_filter_Archaea_38_6]|nr:MAG: hypothetical protein COS64_03510 [archaeon CG06_land_8_20_14_3_00_37_11]PJA22660.1 MAG: hypothetical protein COX58_01560 [archaeon CG_4_10_14_0_2_um_filter_Archaea_38_6]
MKKVFLLLALILVLGCAVYIDPSGTNINFNMDNGSNADNASADNNTGADSNNTWTNSSNAGDDLNNTLITSGNNTGGNNTVIDSNGTNTNNTIIDSNNTGNNTFVQQNSSINYAAWTDGEISLSVPDTWSVVSYGECATKSFVAYDSSNPLRQVFYFSEAGPVYISEEQKSNDLSWKDYYASIGATYYIFWTDSPVVSPLTAENFLNHFKELADANIMSEVAPLAPKIHDVQVISSETPSQLILPTASDAKIIRALFSQGSGLGEGLFYVETAEFPIAGIGYGMTFIGLTAGEDEFLQYEPILNQIMGSYSISDSYVSACLQAQNQAAQSALKTGEILSETSDIIMDSWDSRQQSDDILSEKWSDTTLGYERVYDPETGDVYRVENGFYDSYNINRDAFEMSDLEQLPTNSWDLWTASTYTIEYIK